MATTVHRWSEIAGSQDAVYIGRAGKGELGPWGNPFRVGIDGRRGECSVMFQRWLLTGDSQGCNTAHESDRVRMLVMLHTLRGKKLGCFCKPGDCHGDVLAKLVDRIR